MLRTSALVALYNVALLVFGVTASSESFSRGVITVSFALSFQEAKSFFTRILGISQKQLTSFPTAFIVALVAFEGFSKYP